MGILQKLNGWKKIIAALAGVILPVALEQSGVSREASMQLTAVLVAYLIGQGIGDNGKNKLPPVVPQAQWRVDPSSPQQGPMTPIVTRRRKAAPVSTAPGPMPVAPV